MGKKKSGGKSSTPNGIALIVGGVILLAIIYVITSLAMFYRAGAPVWAPWKWGKVGAAQEQPGDDDADTTARTIAISSDGNAIKDGGAYSMGRNAVSGITYLTETQNNQTYVPEGEIYVTAELSNEYINGAFDWSVKFANPAAEWAVGKVADYYVAADAVPGDSSRVKLRYIAPFAEQIILTATLRGSDSSDSCTVDCVKPVTSFKFEYYGDFEDNANFYVDEVEYGAGTVTGEFNFKSGYIALQESFKTDIQNYLKFNVSIGAHSFSADDVFLKDSSNGVYCNLDISMFVEGYNDYDTAHKEAIMFAWAKAYDELSVYDSNLTISIEFYYDYNGVHVKKCIDSDKPVRDIACYEGNWITPNTTLNKNYVF